MGVPLCTDTTSTATTTVVAVHTTTTVTFTCTTSTLISTSSIEPENPGSARSFGFELQRRTVLTPLLNGR